MAIFNSYVKLPEGILIFVAWSAKTSWPLCWMVVWEDTDKTTSGHTELGLF